MSNKECTPSSELNREKGNEEDMQIAIQLINLAPSPKSVAMHSLAHWYFEEDTLHVIILLVPSI